MQAHIRKDWSNLNNENRLLVCQFLNFQSMEWNYTPNGVNRDFPDKRFPVPLILR